MTIQVSRLRELLHYDPDTGVFTWIKTAAHRVPAGTVAGALSNKGYLRIQIDRKIYPAHRLAWLYVHGTWPRGFVDHINRNRVDNRISNLRDVNASQNVRNCGLRATNTSGYKGVSYWTERKKWAAQIRLNGKNKLLGMFATPEEASAAYKKAAETANLEH